MASSYEDIEGPITTLTLVSHAFNSSHAILLIGDCSPKINIADEFADELAQYLADDNFHLQAEVKRNNGLLYCEVVRHGNMFAAWEK